MLTSVINVEALSGVENISIEDDIQDHFQVFF